MPDLENHFTDPSQVPARDPKYIMTIVFDLDQTLISADGIGDECENDRKTQLVIRPHASQVLRALRTNDDVEFIIWTAGLESHAKRVVYSFPEIKFDYIVSRDKSWYVDKDPKKTLSKLASETRNLNSMILVDDRMDIGSEHPENLLIVPKYYPKKEFGVDDVTLLYAANILQRAINKYRNDKVNPLYSYLYSPLSEKCVYNDIHYYGVKCFKNKEDIISRIRSFQ